MLPVFLLITLISGASPQTPTSPPTDPSAPCCVPPKFMGVGRILTGSIHHLKGESSEVNFILEFDRENLQVGTENTVVHNNHTSTYKIIKDYRKGVQYMIKGHECVKSSLEQKTSIGCIPSNSTMMANYWFGSMEKYGEHMYAKTYWTTVNGLTGFVAVTEKDCAMVTETVYGSIDSVPTMRSTVLVNQTNWVDPSFFNLPDSCIMKPELPVNAPWSKLTFMDW